MNEKKSLGMLLKIIEEQNISITNMRSREIELLSDNFRKDKKIKELIAELGKKVLTKKSKDISKHNVRKVR